MPGKRPKKSKTKKSAKGTVQRKQNMRLVVGKALDAFEGQLTHGRSVYDQIPAADQVILAGIKQRVTSGSKVTATDLRNIRKVAKRLGIPLKF